MITKRYVSIETVSINDNIKYLGNMKQDSKEYLGVNVDLK